MKLRKGKNKMEVLGAKIITITGKTRHIKPRCELCKYADINSNDDLMCTHKLVTNNGRLEIGVKEKGKCKLFNMSKQMLEDIRNELIK